MSLSAVYLQHRLQLMERHTSTVIQFLKIHQPDDAEELADLERVWRAECEALHAAFIRDDSVYFEKKEEEFASRSEEDDWDAQ